MFGLFKKRAQQRKAPPSAEPNPAEVFSMLGPSFEKLWLEFVNGEHDAVDMYVRYKDFTRQLNSVFSDVNFDRILPAIDGATNEFSLTAGEYMYIYLLADALQDKFYKKSISISDPNNISNVATLSLDDLMDFDYYLNESDISYCNRLKNYLETNIQATVNDATLTQYGYKKATFPVSVNTAELLEYHVFIAERKECQKDHTKHWWQIAGAPIWGNSINPQNPIIPVDIRQINAFVMDYICFATMLFPTVDMVGTLHYKSDEMPETIYQIIEKQYGKSICEYIDRIISEMNGPAFRFLLKNEVKL